MERMEPSTVRRDRWIRYGIAAIAFSVMAAAWHFGSTQSGGIATAEARKAMPALVMSQLGGGTWRLTDHRGQVVLVNYWATWCGPCREETPGLIRLSHDLGEKELAIVGVSLDEGGTEKVQRFVDALHVTYPVALPQPMSQLAYGMAGLPTSILVDRQGRVAKTYTGAVQQRDFEKDVRALLAER